MLTYFELKTLTKFFKTSSKKGKKKELTTNENTNIQKVFTVNQGQ